MTLLIDLGNSRIKWTTLECKPGVSCDVFAHHGRFSGENLERITGSSEPAREVICAAVADQTLVGSLSAHFRRVWQREVQYVTASERCLGLVNGYREPTRLGVDRWLAMLAARELVEGGFCVIDAGTAMTVDLVDAQGRHQGGWIIPGERLMVRSLVNNTGQITQGSDKADTIWGQSTAEAVALGTRAAVAGVVAEVENRLQNSVPDQVQIVVTGGGGSRIIEFLSEPALLVPDLVLDGLALWTHNKRNE
jgi:type III pantothenate kinase